MTWYWNGVFGELYGSAVETRIARDFMEVPGWLKGGDEPSTVSETMFRADRLKTMRMRLSAAYKGVNALLMKEGAQDFRSGQKFDHTIFFGENVDIHHIFPQEWCKKSGIKPSVYDSIINKTPLSYRTTESSAVWRPPNTSPSWNAVMIPPLRLMACTGQLTELPPHRSALSAIQMGSRRFMADLQKSCFRLLSKRQEKLPMSEASLKKVKTEKLTRIPSKRK